MMANMYIVTSTKLTTDRLDQRLTRLPSVVFLVANMTNIKAVMITASPLKPIRSKPYLSFIGTTQGV